MWKPVGRTLESYIRVNIIVLNDTCEIDGGAARIAIEDAKQMASRGHRVIFFSAGGRPPTADDGLIEWISLGQANILQERRRWLATLRGLWNFRASWALDRLLASLPAVSTVIHLHSWSKALSGSVLSSARRRGVPVVCTLHDYFVACPNGGLYDYPTQRVCGLPPMSLQCASRNCDSRAYTHKVWRILRQLAWRHLAKIPRDFAAMIAVSAFSEAKLRPLLLNPALTRVDNLPRLDQQRTITLEKRYGMVFAGRVASEKGVEVYLEACQRAGLQAEVWGDGPILAQLKLRWPQAHFSGWLNQAELQSRLRSALVLVVPSRWYETYGMVVAEAAAAGVAVVVSDNGAAADLVEHEVTGLRFRSADVVDLAAKLSFLHKQPEFALQMGMTAHRRFWDNYESRREQRAAAIEAVYASVIKPTT